MAAGEILPPNTPSDPARSVIYLDNERSKSNKPSLSGGGGGGTFDPMEARVSKLEAAVTAMQGDLSDVKKETTAVRELLLKIDAKLDGKASTDTLTRIAGEFGARMVGVEKELGTKATTSEIAGLKGAVDKLPTTWQIMGPMAGLIFATLAGVAGLAFALSKLLVPGH